MCKQALWVFFALLLRLNRVRGKILHRSRRHLEMFYLHASRSYEDEDAFEEEAYDEDISCRNAMMPPPPYHGQRQLNPQLHQHPQQHPLNGNHRKDRIENGEIVRETDFGESGSNRFPGNSGQPHSGNLIEKDEFNKIIPESKKGPQVGKSL